MLVAAIEFCMPFNSSWNHASRICAFDCIRLVYYVYQFGFLKLIKHLRWCEMVQHIIAISFNFSIFFFLNNNMIHVYLILASLFPLNLFFCSAKKAKLSVKSNNKRIVFIFLKLQKNVFCHHNSAFFRCF